ncbi:amino acid transporter arg-13 [Cordyceps militaris CM01]|uniref:Amino acid transporter arg-13 n=2 Tax=Cordyceps militaris TaxID=73501 RepID=G3JHP2_CORMM|nr:amino acid transporter arg-13 [Cordyceps militaris CM01]ATY58795.1 amino acid transporter arg-13 [Cordyceps militaris]EGX91748.1 amino acid transporter arg-13 [Cordyceps militaris CM01]
MNPTAVAIEAPPVIMAPEVSLPVRNAAKETAEGILYGSIAGIVGKYIEYPFDTVKVRLQSQPDRLPLRYKGPLDCFRQSLRADGFLGMYRGISAPLVGAAAETSSLFIFESLGREGLYASGLARRDTPLSLPALYSTGAFAGALASFVLTPIELVKCKIQVPGGGASNVGLKPLAVVRNIFRHDGLRGFWHGQMGTLIRESGGSAAWFGAKETVTAMFYTLATKKAASAAEQERIRATPLPLWQQAVAGASAGVSYNFLFFPADTIKSRMQTSPLGIPGEKPSFWAEGSAIWRQSGVRGLYRGCGITCLRSAPSSAFIFMVFDGLKRNFPL